jgi:3-oxoacyl-[acyl-carrier-protein] synthase-3
VKAYLRNAKPNQAAILIPAPYNVAHCLSTLEADQDLEARHMHLNHAVSGTQIVAVTHYVPPNCESNTTLEQELGLRKGWMTRRTGVVQRPTAEPDQPLSDLAVAAGEQMQQSLKQHPPGLLLLATSTPDRLLPPTAPRVAHLLGLNGAAAIDLAGACSGFLYALSLAESHVITRAEPVLIIAANILTRRVNRKDPLTAGLFADGAGAVLIKPSREPGGLLGWSMTSDGRHEEDIHIPEGGSRHPYSQDTIKRGGHLMKMERGPALFKHGVEAMTASGRQALERAQLDVSQIDWWIPHQSNARMIDEVGKKLEISTEKTLKTIHKYGNTSAASIPMALSDAVADQKIVRGQTLLMTSVGSGSIAAGMIYRY